VVVDIGGGSVEITWGGASKARLARSFKLGVIRVTERFVKSDPISARDERRLVRHIEEETGAFLAQLRRRGFQRVVGTSGTILSLGALAAAQDTSKEIGDLRGLRVGARAFHKLRKALADMDLQKRLTVPVLDPRRADLAVAGSILFDTILRALGAKEFVLCDLALREGLVLDYIQRNAAHIAQVERFPDIRRRSAMELAERCRYQAAHTAQVTRLALSIFDQTASLHGLGAREREWLDYAGLLHDVGMHISHEGHHRHSQYLIKHGDLRGFDPEEIDVLSLIARYHRSGAPKKSNREFARLRGQVRRTVQVLSAILSVAEGLDRSHAEVVSGIEVLPSDGQVTLKLQTMGDAELEIWAAARHLPAVEKALGRPVRIEAPTVAAPALAG
jgi:exopolyphosphatase/guanosine-5'-triphosphate,3'-diphosphate pyrophosphatase